MVYLFLANGFEEVEALTCVDLLRRAEIEVKTVSLNAEHRVEGTHQIPVFADLLMGEVDLNHAELLILPGGMPGTTHLMESALLSKLLVEADQRKIGLAAICAAPSVLGRLGLLKGRRATCFPGFEKQLTDAVYQDLPVCRDEHILSGKAAGCAVDFALLLIGFLKGQEMADRIRRQIFY